MEKVAYGLKDMWLADAATSNALGANAEKVRFSVEGVPTLNMAEPTTTEFNIEESDFPFFQTATPGATTFSGEAYFNDPEQLAKYFGGTVVPGVGPNDPSQWKAPLQVVSKEISAALVHREGGYLLIPYGKLSARFEWAFQKNALPRVIFTIAVLNRDEAIPPITWSQAAFEEPSES